MSDPIAFVQYEPNTPPAPAPAEPAGGDPGQMIDALAAQHGLELEPWQWDLVRRNALDRMTLAGRTTRAAMSRMANQMQDLAELMHTPAFDELVRYAERVRAEQSACWAEYHRRRR